MSELTLWQGDCLELMKNIPDKSIDMILCDLPYGTTNNKWDKKIDLQALWEQYKRIIKVNAAIVLFSQMPFCVDLIVSNRKWFRYEWIWQKAQGTGHLNANRMPLKIHENILIFYDKLPTYNPQKTYGHAYYRAKHYKGSTNYGKQDECETICADGSRYPTDVIKYAQCNCTKEKPIHPTQKPVDLLEYLIKTYTNEGETVLDNCMGSGSTGVACVNTNRDFIGIELDENYFQIAKNRIEETQTAHDVGGFSMP